MEIDIKRMNRHLLEGIRDELKERIGRNESALAIVENQLKAPEAKSLDEPDCSVEIAALASYQQVLALMQQDMAALSANIAVQEIIVMNGQYAVWDCQSP